MRGLALTVLAAGACLAASRSAAADPGPAVTWSAPPGCPDAGHFAIRVAAHLGNPQAARGIGVTVEITARDGGFSLLLRTADGERALEGDTCADVVEAAALVLALAIDRGADTDDPTERRVIWATDTESPPPAGRDAPAPVVVRDRPRPESGVRLLLHAVAGGDAGSLPGPTASFGAGAGIGVGTWRIEAGAHHQLERTAHGADETEGTGIYMVFGSLEVCRRALIGPLGVCAGGELGRLHAESFGYDAPGRAEAWWGALTAGLSWSRRLGGPLDLRVDARLAAPLIRPAFGPQDLDTPDPTDLAHLDHQPSHVSGRVLAGLEVAIP